jgi:hypothetical protein
MKGADNLTSKLKKFIGIKAKDFKDLVIEIILSPIAHRRKICIWYKKKWSMTTPISQTVMTENKLSTKLLYLIKKKGF